MRLARLAAGLVATTLAFGCGPRPTDDETPRGPGLPLTDGPEPEGGEGNLDVGPLKPFRELSRTLDERLFAARGALDLTVYFQDPPDPTDIFAFFKPSLADLLGAHDGDGLRSGLKNATPNSVNMLLWYMIAESLAAELAGVCDEEPGEARGFAHDALKPAAREALRGLCAWPSPEARSDAALAAVWATVMRSDAPRHEELVWRAFLQSEVYAAAAPKDALREALVAVIYNPFFLLAP